MGSDRRYTLHGPKCASTPLSIHPSIHLLADISTYSRRKDLNTGELILTFRAWSGADHHQHIRGEGLQFKQENPFDFPGTPLTGQHSGGSLFTAVELRNAS